MGAPHCKSKICCLFQQINIRYKPRYVLTNLIPQTSFSSFNRNLGCIAPLGMAYGAISDDQIQASSQLNGNHSATQARLYFKGDGVKAGGWSALSNDSNQWLQVDFGSYTRVQRVATQGRYASDQWVTKYKLQYSDDGVAFQVYREPGVSLAKVCYF